MSITAIGASDAGQRVLVPVLRRVMQLGDGPPALVGWLRARNVSLAPRSVWTPSDERAVQALVQQLDDVVGKHAVANRFSPLTYQPQDTVRTVVLRVESR